MTETQERFLRAVAARVPLDRIAEVYLFPPIRQGGVEAGLAVVAAEPEAVRRTDDAAAPEHFELAGGTVGPGALTATEGLADSPPPGATDGVHLAAAPAVRGGADVAGGAAAVGEVYVEQPAEPTADVLLERSVVEGADLANDTGVGASDDRSADDCATGIPMPDDRAGAAPAMTHVPPSGALERATAPAATSSASADSAGAPPQYQDAAEGALEEGRSRAGGITGPHSEPHAGSQTGWYSASLAAPARHTVFSARYRLTLKGPDRGKWEVDVVAEADAPLVTIDAVVRGLRKRTGEAADAQRVHPDVLRELAAAPA